MKRQNIIATTAAVGIITFIAVICNVICHMYSKIGSLYLTIIVWALFIIEIIINGNYCLNRINTSRLSDGTLVALYLILALPINFLVQGIFTLITGVDDIIMYRLNVQYMWFCVLYSVFLMVVYVFKIIMNNIHRPTVKAIIKWTYMLLTVAVPVSFGFSLVYILLIPLKFFTSYLRTQFAGFESVSIFYALIVLVGVVLVVIHMVGSIFTIDRCIEYYNRTNEHPLLHPRKVFKLMVDTIKNLND